MQLLKATGILLKVSAFDFQITKNIEASKIAILQNKAHPIVIYIRTATVLETDLQTKYLCKATPPQS